MRLKVIVVAAILIGALLMTGTALAQGEEGSGAPAIDQLSDFVKWSIAAGFIGTFIIGAINRAHWSSEVKFLSFFLWCCLAAAVTAYFKRELDFQNWTSSLLAVFVAGQATYLAGKSAVKGVEARTG